MCIPQRVVLDAVRPRSDHGIPSERSSPLMRGHDTPANDVDAEPNNSASDRNPFIQHTRQEITICRKMV